MSCAERLVSTGRNWLQRKGKLKMIEWWWRPIRLVIRSWDMLICGGRSVPSGEQLCDPWAISLHSHPVNTHTSPILKSLLGVFLHLLETFRNFQEAGRQHCVLWAQRSSQILKKSVYCNSWKLKFPGILTLFDHRALSLHSPTLTDQGCFRLSRNSLLIMSTVRLYTSPYPVIHPTTHPPTYSTTVLHLSVVVFLLLFQQEQCLPSYFCHVTIEEKERQNHQDCATYFPRYWTVNSFPLPPPLASTHLIDSSEFKLAISINKPNLYSVADVKLILSPCARENAVL